jgi:hypothetical protein
MKPRQLLLLALLLCWPLLSPGTDGLKPSEMKTTWCITGVVPLKEQTTEV